MKELGKLKYFLGIKVSWNAIGIFLSQQRYALNLISDHGPLGAKPATIPIEKKPSIGIC